MNMEKFLACRSVAAKNHNNSRESANGLLSRSGAAPQARIRRILPVQDRGPSRTSPPMARRCLAEILLRKSRDARIPLPESAPLSDRVHRLWHAERIEVR